MKLLFIHQGFPGQYIHILRALHEQGTHQLVGLGIEEACEELPPSVQYFRYGLGRGNQEGLHPWVLDMETKTIRGEACAYAANQLKEKGFTPDLICGHPGWGEMLFLKDIWPSTPTLSYQEFFYNPRGFDYDFDHEFQKDPDWKSSASIRAKNANQLLNLASSTWSVTPTQFQRNSFPRAWQDRISVIHDGIDTNKARPNPRPGPVELPNGKIISENDQIVTFVNRSFEPYRGCHTMIRAIPYLQQYAPDAQLIMIGSTNGVSYGSPCPNGEWKDLFLAEIEGQYNPENIHFIGNIPHDKFIPILQLSKAHVYLTYPFVLSWSLLEAMSCECPIVGSATAPVEEVIKHNQNGLLVDFFEPKALAKSIAALLNNPTQSKKLGAAARQTILKDYELNLCVKRQLSLIELVASGVLGQ